MTGGGALVSGARAHLAANVATVAGVATMAAFVLIAVWARPAAARRLEPPHRPDQRRVGLRPSRRSLAVAATVLGAVCVSVAGPVPAGAAAAAFITLALTRRRRASAVRRRAVEAAMPDAIELLVLCIHAGRSPTQSVLELARRGAPAVRAAFSAVELQLHRGRRLADALGELPRTIGAPARELASAIAMADREGLPLAPVLDRLATEARAERRRLGEAAARRLPVRLSFPLVLCTLPAFVLLAIAPAVLGAISTLRGTAP
jgi:Flp pilus assembly protein TadB